MSLSSFARYQREDAWTWEHMALTRARPVFGTTKDRAALEAIVVGVLGIERDSAKLRTDVLAMRAEMATHKPPRGSFDAKLQRGGLVDLEFLVHFVQLNARAGFAPDLGAALDTLIAAGLLPPALRPAHDLLTRMLIAGRLFAPDGDYPPEASRAVVAKAAQVAGWVSLLDEFAKAREAVAAAWAQVFGEQLEMGG